MSRVRETHPAFGMVRFSRVHGKSVLVGSELIHHDFIELTVKTAVKDREVSHDWWFGQETIVELSLTPMQFAELLTCMNVGDGVPCTLTFRGDLPNVSQRRVERWEGDLENARTRFRKEAGEKGDQVLASLAALHQKVEDVPGLSQKARASLLDEVNRATREVRSNLPHIVDQFREKMESVVSDAKATIEAHLLGVITRTGLTALRSMAPQLDAPKPEVIDALPLPDEGATERLLRHIADNQPVSGDHAIAQGYGIEVAQLLESKRLREDDEGNLWLQ